VFNNIGENGVITFIENDCHNLQLKCPIKIRRNRHALIAIITTYSLIAPDPTQVGYTDRNYYIFLYR